MFIPEEKISEILNTSDIVDVISESVMLKKSGRNFFGLCPFHSEKTPSFSVNPDRQIFHCFGCSTGGNALSFVMKFHGISFPEAARMLARKYNITIDTATFDPAQKRAIELKEALFRLNKKAMAVYASLFRDRVSGAGARAYLEKRGITDQTVETFNLGFAPDLWDTMVTFLKKEKVTRKVAENCGLILPGKKGGRYYDRFRNRLIFPIFDVNMQVAGFGGRVMDDSMPKYLNSPETPVYSKSRILYGLHAAKQHCRREGTVYIVEGYFDFLSLFQHGIKNTVASLGTALTRDHVRILKGYASRMILVFDSDDAGIHAARRSVAIFMAEGVDTRILVLPGKNDPDSYVMAHGAEGFKSLAAKAKTVMKFLLQLAMDTHGLSVEGRIKILEEMTPHLARIRDSALRSLHVRQLSETLNIDERAVLEKVRNACGSRKEPGSALLADRMETVAARVSDPREKQILGLMLNYPWLIPLAARTKVVDYFYSERFQQVARKIMAVDPDSGSFTANVMAKLDNTGDQELLASLAMAEPADPDLEGVQKTAMDLMNRIIKIRKKDDNTITEKIINAEKGCDADVMELLKKKQQEIQKLHNRL